VAGRQSCYPVRAQFQHFKLVATGRAAVSMPSMVLYLPISFIFALEREFALSPGSLNDQIRIVLAGELTSFLFLHLSAVTLLRKRKNQGQNLYLCIFVWAMTGVIRGYFAEFYATSTLGYESHWDNRIILSAIFATLGLGLSAYTFGYIYEIEIKKSVLLSLNRFISADSKKLNSNQIAMKEEAIITLQQNLIPKVIQLQSVSSGIKRVESSAALALSLQSLEEQAHRLAYQMRVNLDNLESIPNPRSSAVSRRFTSSRVLISFWPTKLSVKLSFLFLSTGGVIVQYGRNSVSGVMTALLSSVLSGIVLFVFDRMLKKPGIPNKRFLYVSAYIAVFAIQVFYASRLMPELFELSQSFSPWYSATKVTFAVFMASSFLSYIEADSALLKEMSDEISNSRESLKLKTGTNEILASINTTTNQGALQGKISGVILALNMILEDEELNKTGMDPALVINSATKLITGSIVEIENLSTREILD
jgi:hypothetical protein